MVTGSAGLVGSKVAELGFSHGFEVYGTHDRRASSFPGSVRLDVSDRDDTLSLVRRLEPHVIINAAALTNVDYCELHKDEADRVNVRGVSNLAEAAMQYGIRLVQISTDSVFDGTRGHYLESDTPNPINIYSATKLESEKVVSQLSSYAIARPSVVYGWHPQVANEIPASTKSMNFAMFVLDKLKRGERVNAVTDQYSSPTLADQLADALLRLAKMSGTGTFHTAGRSCLTRFEFARIIANEFGYSTELVQPVLTSELEQVAKRPRNCCLSVEKAERILGVTFPTAREGILEMKKQAVVKNN
jgi:dTDP-4-dehydrorhamnose reductase